MGTTASLPLPGDNIISGQFTLLIMPFVLASLLVRERHRLFEWLITVIGSYLVCSGTFERILQITNRAEWQTTPAQVEAYFYQSLTAWIACIVVDGRHTFNMVRAYHWPLEWQNLSRLQQMELAGVILSCISMIKFSFNVYYNFMNLTQDPALYLWFFMAVFFKILRIFVQGLVLTMDTRRLNIQNYATLTIQLMFSSVFLLIQTLFLAQFTPFCSWSAALLLCDVAYRLYQFIILAYHWLKIHHPQQFDSCKRMLFSVARLIKHHEHTLDCIGLSTSVIAMVLVTSDLHNCLETGILNHWIFFGVYCIAAVKLKLMFIQGVAVPVDTQRLKLAAYRKLLRHHLLTGICLTMLMAVIYLTLLATDSLSAPFLAAVTFGAHCLHRLHQIARPLLFCYHNFDTCSETHHIGGVRYPEGNYRFDSPPPSENLLLPPPPPPPPREMDLHALDTMQRYRDMENQEDRCIFQHFLNPFGPTWDMMPDQI